MTDGRTPYHCSSFRILVLYILTCCHTVLTYLDTWIESQNVCCKKRPHDDSRSEALHWNFFPLLVIMTADDCSFFSIKTCTVLSVNISFCPRLHEGSVSEPHQGWGEAPGEPSDPGGCDWKPTHLSSIPTWGPEETQWGCGVSRPTCEWHLDITGSTDGVTERKRLSYGWHSVVWGVLYSVVVTT